MSIRKLVLLLSAIAAVVLGLERVGIFQFLPEGDVHFEAQSLLNPPRLVLHSDVGDLTCWVRLVVRAHSSEPIVLRAAVGSGDPLTVVSRRVGVERYEVLLTKSPRGASSFLWNAGLPLQVLMEGKAPGRSLTIEDWTLYRNDHASDSHAKAMQRWWWTRISWCLLVMALLGTAITAWQEKDEREIITTRTLVQTIIVNIEGRDAAETRKIRRFLTQVLLSEFTVAQALEAAQLAGSRNIVRGQFLARATSLFRERVELVRQELDRYNGYLTP